MGSVLIFGLGIGLAVTSIQSANASALATIASFLLGGIFGLAAYFGRELLITQNVARALYQEISNAHAECKQHLEVSDYEKAKQNILADVDYIPYIGWQPIPHELYRKVIEELFLLTEDVIVAVQRAYDSEVTIEIMVTKMEGDVFKGMKQGRRTAFLGSVREAIVEDEKSLAHAAAKLKDLPILQRFFLG
jgi:hypothetical protein